MISGISFGLTLWRIAMIGLLRPHATPISIKTQGLSFEFGLRRTTNSLHRRISSSTLSAIGSPPSISFHRGTLNPPFADLLNELHALLRDPTIFVGVANEDSVNLPTAFRGHLTCSPSYSRRRAPLRYNENLPSGGDPQVFDARGKSCS